MADQRYSIAESCGLLDCDRMTLARWLDIAGITPQGDPADKRYKYITRAQIQELARVHNRTIREDRVLTASGRLTSRDRAILERLERIEERLGRLEAGGRAPVPPRAEAPDAASLVQQPPRVTDRRNPLPALPDGWVPAVDVGRAHGVAESTMHGWQRSGRWPQPHRGQWASGGPGTFPIRSAYDEGQQRAIAELMGGGEHAEPEPSGSDGDAE